MFYSKGGSTSAVRNHLVGTHHIDIDNAGSTSSPSVASFLMAKRPALSKTRSIELDRKIAAFIAQDARPISLVEGKGFRNLMAFLEPEYELKSRTTTTELIKKMYNEGVQKLKLKLRDAKYVAFTTDMWTSIQNVAYMCITAHWINNDWELEAAVLQTRETPERHTGHNISIRLADCASEWGISVDKIAATVHDNGSNINLAIDLLDDWPDQRCFSHTLQLAIGAGLKVPAIDRMLGAARRLAAHFKRSTVAAQALREKQAALQANETSNVSEIVIDCSTRWNSVLDMLERLVELRWAIGAVLSDPNTTHRSAASTYEMTDDNWSLAQALVPVLKPFKQVTTMSSGQSYPSVSSVYPQLYIILKHIAGNQPDENTAVKQCRTSIAKELRSRYYPEGYSTLNASKAAVLDPRYKLLKFYDHHIRQETLDAVRLELDTLPLAPPTADNNSVQVLEEPKNKRARMSDDNIFADLTSLCAAEDATTTSDELAAYLMETPLSLHGDILQYWRDNSNRYPKLSVLAQKYLCIPATSVPSESVFSTAGHIVNKKRASLDPDTVDILVFLSRNWKLCCENEK